ncbi:inositol polyphosphate 5-phosphatase OCRL-1 [Lingula anatina]|uniref:phosphoinositide 5-phosphatase n=1 Tax=Lingula anatina TaxID=7574 RepID=A0A1S3K951_LINAN|nr:inositol polyphosphate 5-phosphatase OCRL-1 [Lingula anatina]XP_013418983.1 inositol polyphosphate 5-phosphatase OCRL-1 [Lingula anatina]|eukprot:XP_013418974.1 inositol polyphosphate 5-phosphatase OCRL-1 [Lingula anatina]
MELTAVVQKKLAAPERCLCCIQASLINPSNGSKSPRILAIVEREGDYGLFVHTTSRLPVLSPGDLTVEKALPVTNDTRCQTPVALGSIKQGDPVLLTIMCSSDNLKLQIPNGPQLSAMLKDLKKGIDVYSQNAGFGLPSSFSWLDKYSKSQIDNNPFANDVFDPTKHMPEKTEPEVSDWPWGHIAKPVDNGATPMVHARTSPVWKPVGFEDSFSNLSVDSKSSASSSRELGSDMYSSIDSAIGHAKPEGPRESIVKLYMSKVEDQFTRLETIRLFCGTWNTNGQPPGDTDLSPWLAFDQYPPDIYAIGFQELDLSNQAFIFAESQREQEWFAAVRQGLHPQAAYKKLCLIRLVGMMLILFVKKELTHHIKKVKAEQVGTGLLGMMGNKGGVAVRFELFDTSFCIINSHLAAHMEEYERRNQDYRDINSRLQFRDLLGYDNPQSITDHDRIFWLGDLNYRISGLDLERVKKECDAGNYSVLYEYDQLIQQRSLKNVFLDYEEAPIKFKPTYKYDTGTDSWDTSEKCRCPAWCDRVMWKGEHIENEAYRSHPILKTSDHKPVSAYFSVKVKKIDIELYRKTYEEMMKKLDRLENEFLPSVTLDKYEVKFENVLFIEPQAKTLQITNTGQVPVHFEFINKLKEKSFCKPWLSVKPFSADILMGDSVTIDLEVYVNKDTAPTLNAGDDTIEDILVLHLEGGKDFFISVTGSYTPSCFGSSIESLVNMVDPIREIPTDTLISLEHIPTSPAGEKRKSFFGDNVEPLDIPKELYRLVDYIYKQGKEEEELFQQPGLHTEIQWIRDCLDTGTPDTMSGSVHSAAEALLMFLEALPEPVIPYDLYQPCLDSAIDFETCKKILLHMPPAHHNVFVYIMAFLRELLKYKQVNGVDVGILAPLFGGVVLRPPPEGSNKRAKSQEYSKRSQFVQHFLLNEYDCN